MNRDVLIFQMFKLVLEKAEEPEIKLPTSAGSSKKQETRRICWCHSGDITNHELALEETHLPTEAVESGAVENQGLRRIYQGWPNQEKKKKITHSQNRILSGSTFLLPSCFLFFFQVVMVRNKKGCDLVFVLVGFSSKKVHHFLRSFPCPSHMKATRNLGITHI